MSIAIRYFIPLAVVFGSHVTLAQKIDVQWKDGDILWYKATYHDPLNSKANILDDMPLCPSAQEKHFSPPEQLDNKCYYKTSAKHHKWIISMLRELNLENDKQKLLPPEKKKSRDQLNNIYESIKSKYARNCPQENAEIVFTDRGWTEYARKTAFGAADEYTFSESSSGYTDVECRSSRNVNCPSGYSKYDNRKQSGVDILPIRPGCVKFKDPSPPMLFSERPDVYLACEHGGCIDYSKSEKLSGPYQIRFSNGTYHPRRVFTDPNYMNHYCRLNQKSPETATQCQTYHQYKAARMERNAIAAAETAKIREEADKSKELASKLQEKSTHYKQRLLGIVSAAKSQACTPWMDIPNMFVACESGDATAKSIACNMVKQATDSYRTSYDKIYADVSREPDEIKAVILPTVSQTIISKEICK